MSGTHVAYDPAMSGAVSFCAMSGTDTVYRPTRCPDDGGARCSADPTGQLRYLPTRVLRDVRCGHSVWCYMSTRATRFPNAAVYGCNAVIEGGITAGDGRNTAIYACNSASHKNCSYLWVHYNHIRMKCGCSWLQFCLFMAPTLPGYTGVSLLSTFESSLLTSHLFVGIDADVFGWCHSAENDGGNPVPRRSDRWRKRGQGRCVLLCAICLL
eukprot:2142176-Rhodomonas_salina.4